MVSSKSNPYLDGQTVAATVARSRSSGVDILAPPFCDLPMEEGATLERQMFPACALYLSTEPVRRDNWSAYCPADTLLVGEAHGDLYIRIARHEIEDAATHSSLNSLSFQSFSGLFLLYGLCALAMVSFHIIAGLWWLYRRARGADERTGELNEEEELGRGVTAPRRYHYREVAEATGNFADSRRIGRGGFGAVYRGFLTDAGGRHVAVKALSPESVEQGRKEFEAEVRIIGRLRHRSLVELLGWCDCRRGLFLVYQLVPEGSLDRHLHSSDRLLNWSERYTIALDLGSAILYLHTECEQRVVHGDIKTSNVMLDSSLRAKLGDFGLARLVDHGEEPQTTQVVAGTLGYIDPEFIATRRPSVESDVYSFGVVLLEIASGKRPTAASGQPAAGDDAPALLRRVRGMYNCNSILDAADQRLNGQFDRQQMERVLVTGLWCAHRNRARRPSIAQAMAALRPEGAGLPDFPAEFLVDLEQIHGLQEQAFGDLSFGSTRSSAATAYHTPADSSYLGTEE